MVEFMEERAAAASERCCFCVVLISSLEMGSFCDPISCREVSRPKSTSSAGASCEMLGSSGGGARGLGLSRDEGEMTTLWEYRVEGARRVLLTLVLIFGI